jgi:hypothetical protein
MHDWYVIISLCSTLVQSESLRQDTSALQQSDDSGNLPDWGSAKHHIDQGQAWE